MKVQVKKTSLFSGHKDCIYTIVSEVQGESIFSASGDGQVVRWQIGKPDEGRLVAQVPSSVYAMLVVPDSGMLVIAQNFEGLHLVDPASKKEIKNLKLPNTAFFDVQRFGEKLFVAGGNGEIYLIDLRTFSVVSVKKASDKSVRTLAINPLEGHLAAGYSDHIIRVFDLHNLHLIHEMPGHENSVFTLAYSSKHQTLISGGRDARLKTWGVAGGYSPEQTVAAHMYAINSIALSPSGEYFATGSMDKSVKVWATNPMQLLKVIDKSRHAGHGTSVNKVLWGKTDEVLISCGDDRTISVWALEYNTEA